jgi:hypothetical protein
VTRRPEESWPLPARLHPLADACGWAHHVESRAATGRTFVPRVRGHESSADLRVDRKRGDREAIEREAPAAAARVAARHEDIAATREAQAAALLKSAADERATAARIRAALAALDTTETTTR